MERDHRRAAAGAHHMVVGEDVPSWVIRNPEPTLVPCRPVARTVTTLGSNRAATPAKLSGGRCACAAGSLTGSAPSTVPTGLAAANR